MTGVQTCALPICERVPAEIILPVKIVDAANYQPWDRPFAERESPRWEDVVK